MSSMLVVIFLSIKYMLEYPTPTFQTYYTYFTPFLQRQSKHHTVALTMTDGNLT